MEGDYLRDENRKLRLQVEIFRDFIDWIFDKEIDYKTYQEVWDEFASENIDEESTNVIH